MNTQTPEEKATQLMQELNDIHSCIRVCNRMIEGNIVNCANYYKQVKEVLINKK